MKKFYAWLISLCFLLLNLTSCGQNCLHTWGEYQFDQYIHWRYYTCGHTAPNNAEPHFDKNTDGFCDDCGYIMANAQLPPTSADSSNDNSSINNSSTPDSSNDGEHKDYLYTDFTEEEKAIFMRYIGLIIPFAPNNEYYVVGYYEPTGYDEGISFYTYGNSKEDFYNYLLSFDGYTLTKTYEDQYGDTWYRLEFKDVIVDLSYYYFDGRDIIDLYVYSTNLSSRDDEDNKDEDSDITILTNDGSGLPVDNGDGVYQIDFTKATRVKNVTDQGYYLGGCPTIGSPAVLVIPIEFSDSTASSKGYTVDKIKNAFEKDGECDYYSVYDYYCISSYEQLKLDVTVIESWFRPKYSSSYYESATSDYYGEVEWIGDQLILDEALANLSKSMDLSQFDSDNNGLIDSVILINTLDVGENDFNWAYRYWNTYTDDYGNYFEYDGVSANDYMWASYQFLHESYDDDGSANYNNKNLMNTFTYIHEFGHILGIDDYYDTSYSTEILYGCDIMDSMLGDHNAFTKFNLGWITKSKLINTQTSVTLTLESFSKNGDTIILANDWDEDLGAYQEYYVIVYYTMDGLNGGDAGYFLRDGIVVYHVNSSLFKEVYEGETYYDVYNNNTSPTDDYGTENNLIEFVKSPSDTFTYVVGDMLSENIFDDNNEKLGYSFTINSLDEEKASITIKKIA